MEETSMLEFRRRAAEIIRRVQKGHRIILTYRGKPAIRLEPLIPDDAPRDDPFYLLPRLAVESAGDLDNERIDQIVYGE